MVAKIITVVNHKGGVGKTMTTESIGHGLAQKGKRVLMVDLDPQANLGEALNVEPEPGTFYLLTAGRLEMEKKNLLNWVRSTGRENLDILPGSQETAAAQILLSAQQRPISTIYDNLTPFSRLYDFILLDTAPSEGGVQERAIWAANQVIIPTTSEVLSALGVKKVLEMITTLKNEKGWKGGLLTVIPTFFEERLTEPAEVLNDMRSGLGSRLFSPIHKATIFAKCVAEGKTIFELGPKSRSAREYWNLISFVLKH